MGKRYGGCGSLGSGADAEIGELRGVELTPLAFDVGDVGGDGAGLRPFEDLFEVFGVAFEAGLDGAVVLIADPSVEVKGRGLVQGGEAEADTLHAAANNQV